MAYQNPYYPGNTMNFQPQYQQPVYQQPMGMQAPQPMQDDRIWVASEQAADSYQIVPNGFAAALCRASATASINAALSPVNASLGSL